jgi:nicotinamidase-related amidase
MKVALLVIDVQKGLFLEKPFHAEELIANISGLLDVARSKNIECIYIRHNGRQGGILEPETEGWHIHDEIAPRDGERIIDKNYNSSFKGTMLHEYLQSREIDTLIIVGLQTEYCVDTTCRVSFELGYQNVIPKGGNSTYGNALIDAETMIKYHNEMILDRRFGKYMDIDEVIKDYLLL